MLARVSGALTAAVVIMSRWRVVYTAPNPFQMVSFILDCWGRAKKLPLGTYVLKTKTQDYSSGMSWYVWKKRVLLYKVGNNVTSCAYKVLRRRYDLGRELADALGAKKRLPRDSTLLPESHPYSRT